MKLTIHRYATSSKLYTVLLIVGVVVTLWSLFFAFTPNKYGYLIALPISYIITRLVIRKSLYEISPGIATYEISCFMRYVILPYVILSQDSFNSFAATYEYIGLAVGLMIYEMIATALVIMFYRPKTKQRNTTNISYSSGNKKLIFSFLIVIILLLYIDNRSLTGNLLVFSGIMNNNVATQLSETSSVVSILWQAILSFTFAYSIWSIYRASITSKSKTMYTIISAIICIFYFFVIFTGQVSISRWNVMIAAITSIIWLFTLYPSNKLSILLTVGVPFVIVLVTVSVVKSGGISLLGHSKFEQIHYLITPAFMDAYFAGPVNVNNAIAMKSLGNIGISSLPYDIVNNMPVITNIIDKSHSTVFAFNHLLGRTDQIVPLIGQSFTWFGYIFSPLLSMLFTAAVVKLDYKFMRVDGIDKYCYGFFAAWCGTATILNVTIWFAWVYSKIIPMFLLFAIIRFFIMRRNRIDRVAGGI